MTEAIVQFKVFNDPMFGQNGRIMYWNEGGPCWLIDPGPPPQAKHMAAFVRHSRLVPQAILLTHAHADHIAGIDEVVGELGDLPIYLAKEEWPMLRDANENLSASIGMPVAVKGGDVRDLVPGTRLELDQTTWQILDTSGHSPGGRSLYCEDEKVVIAGDALFAGGVGRYDFPHSDGHRLFRNIRENLLTLPDDTRVLSGHGPDTTIGVERTTNPFLT